MPPNSDSDVDIVDINYEYISDKYLGFWRPLNDKQQEINIKAISGKAVLFSVWYYRLHQFECYSAKIQGNKAEFSAYEGGDNYISGYLTFNGDTITVTITAANAVGIASNTEVTYYGYGNQSVQYGTVFEN